jgi:hypothetical protein
MFNLNLHKLNWLIMTQLNIGRGSILYFLLHFGEFDLVLASDLVHPSSLT